MYNGMYQRIVRYLRHLVDRPPRCEACGRTSQVWQYATNRYICLTCADALGYFEYMQP
jgi:hypothetical protein